MNPILVYQMGKVGSCAVHESLEALALPCCVWHVHALSDRGMEHLAAMRSAGVAEGTTNRRVAKAAAILDQWQASREGRCRVITLVREPLRRRISCFFQHWRDHFPELDLERPLSATWIARIVKAVCTRSDPYFRSPDQWFDDELKPMTGYDVFAQPFPIAKGYTIARAATADVLVIRLEDLGICGAAAMRELLGVKRFVLRSGNRAEDKAYSRQYSQFLRAARFPPDYVEGVYATRYARHFYSSEELRSLRTRWVCGGGG